jgi:hypothetical protein
MEDAGVAAYIGRWRPSSVSPGAAGFARDVVTASAPCGQERAKNLLQAAGKLADWAIGPVLGGVFVTYWSWRDIFLVNVPAGIALVALGSPVIPALARRPDCHLDVRGVVLMGTTLLAAMLGIAYLGGGHSDPASPAFLGAESVAIVTGTLSSGTPPGPALPSSRCGS